MVNKLGCGAGYAAGKIGITCLGLFRSLNQRICMVVLVLPRIQTHGHVGNGWV